jgi:hypothetical protein
VTFVGRHVGWNRESFALDHPGARGPDDSRAVATLWHDRGVPPTSPRGVGREPGPEDSPRESWQRRPRESGRPRRSEDYGGYRGAEPEGYGRREPGYRDERAYPPPEARPRTARPDRGTGNGRAERRPEEDDRGWRDTPVRREREPDPAEPPPSRLQRPRLRRPHKRRAVAGQQTGLDPDLQSDLPSWLQQRGVATAPVRRLLSLSVAMFSALLGFGLLLGAYTLPSSYSFVIFGVQCLFVLAWTVAMRPPGALIVGVVGVLAAGAADLAAVLPGEASLAPLGYVMVGGFVLGVVGQLARGAGRDGVTESLGATLAAVVGAVAFASLLVLNRHQLGTQSIVACLAAAAVALVVSRLSDIVLTTPRTSPEVPRGAIGVVLGAMAGTAAAAAVGAQLVGLHPPRTALAGLVTAMAAIMADLAVSYAEVGREMEGDASSLWVARHMQGPLGGFALAAPAAYVLSVMVLIPGF